MTNRKKTDIAMTNRKKTDNAVTNRKKRQYYDQKKRIQTML